MKKPVFALWRTFLFAALVPALSLSLGACSPDDLGGMDNDSISVNSGVVDKNEKPSDDATEGGVADGGEKPSDDATEGGVADEVEKPSDDATDDGVGDTPEDGTSAIVVGEAVDLGLSVKWASCNVGAESPEDFGGYYAWGETEEKTNYSWSTYKWCNGSYYSQTKYCTSSSCGIVDNKITLDPEDDVAHVKWGGNWRMPTRAEQDELRNSCTWSWTSVNGVNGYRVTGRNGNSIFLPAAGYRDGGYVYGRGGYGFYWSASLHSNYGGYAYYLSFSSGRYDWGNNNRYSGHSVRPVTE